MKILTVLMAVGYVVLGALGMAICSIIYNALNGGNFADGFIGSLMIVGYGLFLCGIQATILMTATMIVIESKIKPNTRILSIFYAVVMSGLSGMLASIISFGIIFPFSIMGLVAGAIGGLLYGFIYKLRSDG